jgi:hypothetical protein
MSTFAKTALPPILRLSDTSDVAFQVRSMTALPPGMATGVATPSADRGLRGEIVPEVDSMTPRQTRRQRVSGSDTALSPDQT